MAYMLRVYKSPVTGIPAYRELVDISLTPLVD